MGNIYVQVIYGQFLILFADEAFWAGDKAGESSLKSLITESKLLLESKGRNAFEIDNYLRIIMASNEDWVIPAGVDERRFFVLEVSDNQKQKHEYFKAIDDQMKNGGREALLYDLMNHDISNFNFRIIPQTKALLDQKLRSLKPIEDFWYDILVEGRLHKDHDDWEHAILTDTLYDSYCEHSNLTGNRRKNGKADFGKKLKEICPDVDNKRRRPLNETIKKPHYVFPSLGRCRELFETYIKETIPWSQPEEEIIPQTPHENDPDIHDQDQASVLTSESIQNFIDEDIDWENL